MDNVKLYRKSEAGPKTVDKVADITKKVTVGSTFTAPTQATVLYTDGTNALFDVTWNSDELAKVDTKTAGRTFTVNGKVTVEGTAYDAVMNVEVLDAPVWFRKFRKALLDPLISMQTGSSIWQREHRKSLMAVSQQQVSKMPEITQQTRLLIRVSMTSDGER